MAHKILIIDDERDMQIYLATLFRRAGYEALTAQNGEEGLTLAVDLRPALITLDLLMPKKSGVIAYEALRRAPETRQIPVIILTGLSRHEALFDAAGENGLPRPDAVVEKPIDRDAFLRTVSALIGVR